MYVLHDSKIGEIFGTQSFPSPDSFKADPQDIKGGKTAAQKWNDYLTKAPVIEVTDGTDLQGKAVDVSTGKLINKPETPA